MRPILALLVGVAVSTVGLMVVVRSDHDIAGVLLMAAGVIVALLGVRPDRVSTGTC